MAHRKAKIGGKLSFELDESAVVGRNKRSSKVVYRGLFEEKIPAAIKRIMKRDFALIEGEQLSQYDRHENIVRYYVTESDYIFQ